PIEDEPPYYYILTTYVSYLFLILLGHIRDFFGKRFGDKKHYDSLKVQNGYAPLNDDFDNFYTRRLKMRLDDCFARPLLSDDFNRTYQYTGTTTETLNMSSYNYLGFAQSEGPCADAVEECVKRYGLTSASPRMDSGTTDLALEVEREIAAFVGKPASMFSLWDMSPTRALVGKGCLIISDELNHASIRIGARLSGAVIKSFKHNHVPTSSVSSVRPSLKVSPNPSPWKKILVVVEGLYSMEGTMCDLPGILSLKDKYNSTSTLTRLTRSELLPSWPWFFGANGGYIAANKDIIDKLKSSNVGMQLGESPTPCVLMQILASLKMITGELCPGQGEERLERIAFNSRYLRLGLKRLGYIVSGHDDSPIVPVMLYHPAKIPAFSHEMLRRKISVVVVGYPATPLITSRARFCVSSAHNKEDLDRLLVACDEIADRMQLRYSSGIAGGLEPLPDSVSPEEEKQWRAETGAPINPPRWAVEDVIRYGATTPSFLCGKR
ncbi:unnamed protein product, partial [Clonostachys rosea f. rosea IK726]